MNRIRLGVAVVLLSAATASLTHAQPQAQRASQSMLSLMPVPSSVTLHNGSLIVDSTFRIAVLHNTDPRLLRAVARMIPRLEYRIGLALPHHIARDSSGAALVIDCQGPGEAVQGIDENESYSIESSPGSITLHATTTVGVIRGLETVLQLVSGGSRHYFIPAASITDAPRFRWRGLLIDVSRHFEPVSAIERTLDGMAAVKLNVLHWHLSDDQGICVESHRYPKLQGMGSDSLDPTRASVYRFIDGFIGDMSMLFPDVYWRGTKYLGQAVAQGFNGILSAPYYLDAMESAEQHYLADPLAGDSTRSRREAARVLSGEACMWAELVADGSIDSRIWPRLAAIAERFWSPQSVADVGDMYRRLAIENVRLEQLGLGQESHTDRFLRRIVNGPNIAPLTELLRFAEPVTLGQRVRRGFTTQMTPLVQIVDAARPDPPERWQIQQMVSDIVSSPIAQGAIPAADALASVRNNCVVVRRARILPIEIARRPGSEPET